MSQKRVKASLKSGTGKELVEGKNRVSLGDGYCVHPFTYKDQQFVNGRCYKANENEYWCATSVKQDKKNPEIKDKLNTWAYCDFEGEKPVKTRKIKRKVVKKTKTKAAAPKKASPKAPSPKAPSPKAPSPKAPSPKAPSPKAASPKTKKIIRNNVKAAQIENEEYILPPNNKLTPKLWVLPNRKEFVNWFDTTYKPYSPKGASLKKGERVDYFNHQKIVRDYIQVDSPYRGILLYHGLGVGKTCASISIAEGFKHNRKVNVLLNKSLKQNYIVNLMFCGDDYFRTNQHWEYHKFSEGNEYKAYAKFLKIPLKANSQGIWFVNFKKQPNYDKLTKKEKESLNEQIIAMIKSRYNFIHLDGLNEKRLLSMIEKRVLDNSVLVIDEVHNLTNAMAKDNPGVRGKYLKQLIMEAENLKLVFLSGTPMINNLFEVGQLFNLLRGYIKTHTFVIKPKPGSSNASWKKIEDVLNNIPEFDQIFIKNKDNTITLTRNPNGFMNSPKRDGLIRTTGNTMSEEEFKSYCSSIIDNLGFSVYKYNQAKYTALPDKEEDFMLKFYDPIKNKIINQELFKARILGLVSYYRTQDKALLPEVRINEVINVPMSDYQFLAYGKVRKVEKKQEKNKKSKSKPKSKSKDKDKDNENVFEAKSSFRSYSRMHCSFVFPESIERPLPGNAVSLDDMADAMLIVNDLEDAESQEEKEKLLEESELDNAGAAAAAADPKILSKAYELAKKKVLRLLERQSQELLVKDDADKLEKYSPKYNMILENISKTEGTAFVYTEYKTLEGIAIFSIVLKANGYAPFLINKKENGEWEQVYENETDIDKPKYAFWGDDEETSDIIRKIYNNDFSEIPVSLQESLKGKTNLHGELIKILLTTKTGAEGIDLKNVRQVHVVEPYWNPVRLKQVKGRAVRVGSHIQLPPSERNVDIFTYLSVMTKEQLKTDKTIQEDSNGLSSDQVLYDISRRKLEVMDTLLRMIKEVSVDCSINYKDTYSADEPFTCVDYGKLTGYSYLPNIDQEREDKERARRETKTEVKYILLKLRNKKKEIVEYYKRDGPYPQQFFDKAAVEAKRPGKPVGQVIITDDGKKKPVFFK